MGVWQNALQKLGLLCQVQKPMPATTMTTTTTPTMVSFLFFLGQLLLGREIYALLAHSLTSSLIVNPFRASVA